MSTYKLYVNNRNGERVIIKDDMVEWKEDHKGVRNRWTQLDQFPAGVFMAGDVALDNGYECKGKMTESEVFAELL